MPAVFVHGVPDTTSMWNQLLGALNRSDTVTLALPGFATPIPDGWNASKDEYAAWLEGELVAIGEPVDLVAHDWGAILSQRVASTRPDLIRTFACGSGPLDVEYEWHAMAQLWQTSDVGEEIVAGMLALPRDDLAAGLAAGGAPLALAALQATTLDALMADCMLKLYRSAKFVGAEWQPTVDAMVARSSMPSMVFHGRDDLYVGEHIAQRLADRINGEFVVYPECGHWWPWARATETAEHLRRLWS